MARTPTDPTKAQVWITKGLDDLDFEFYFPQGPKGDPGGFVLGTLIGNNTNWNSLTSDGIYRVVNPTGNTNTPTDSMYGVLYVNQVENGTRIVQTFYPGAGASGGAKFFKQRLLAGGSWSLWFSYGSQRVDQTAGRAIYSWDDLNNREQLVYGDTGRRNIASLIENSHTTSSMELRRIGMAVSLRVGGLNSTPATNSKFLTIPAGFRSSVSSTRMTCIESTNTVTAKVVVASDGSVYLSVPTVLASESQEFLWVTDQAWPSVLPGTAIGAIPFQ